LDALPVTQARVKKESVKALKTTRLIHKEQPLHEKSVSEFLVLCTL